MELLITVGIFGLVSGLIYLIFASKVPVVEEAIQRRLGRAISADLET